LNTKQRWLAIAALGLVALILAVKAPAPQDNAIAVSKGAARSNVAANNRLADTTTERLELDKLQTRRTLKADTGDMFQSKSWYVPPPPPKPVKAAPPPPPPPPTAPPLPFSYTGSYQAVGGNLVIYLARGDKLYAVSPGDTLDGTYKIEGVNAGELSIMYLPLNISQNLRIGGR